jgi:antitoxin component of MazEF toxin-antitoxin module
LLVTKGDRQTFTTLRKIGNPEGIILPAASIAACGPEKGVELRIEGRTIVITAAGTPRKNLYGSYRAENDLDAGETIPSDECTDEWVW